MYLGDQQARFNTPDARKLSRKDRGLCTVGEIDPCVVLQRVCAADNRTATGELHEWCETRIRRHVLSQLENDLFLASAQNLLIQPENSAVR